MTWMMYLRFLRNIMKISQPKIVKRLTSFKSAAKRILSLVIQANKFYYAYGAEYHAENIKWSGEKILNSCSTSLREKILEEVQEFKVSEGQKASFGKGAEKYSSLNIPPAPIISLKSANVGRTGHKL